MKKHKKATVGLIALLLVMMIWGIRGAAAYNVVELFKQSDAQPTIYPRRAAISLAPRTAYAGVEVGGNTVTHTLTLRAGWNAVYLEVEPDNPSPLINQGTEEEPIWVHKLSTMEAVFAQLECEACLENVWTWNVPFSTQDYIVGQAEGLWDEPGWLRYFPASSLGADGVSRAFLTDLLSLHANTGYLVKMDDDLAAPLTIKVAEVRFTQERYYRGRYFYYPSRAAAGSNGGAAL